MTARHTLRRWPAACSAAVEARLPRSGVYLLPRLAGGALACRRHFWGAGVTVRIITSHELDGLDNDRVNEMRPSLLDEAWPTS